MLIKRIFEASSEINQSYPFRKLSGGWEGVNIYPRMNFEKKKSQYTTSQHLSQLETNIQWYLSFRTLFVPEGRNQRKMD